MMKQKKVILSAGGTGGHLFPAQVIGDQLGYHCDLLFVGAKLAQNRFFDSQRFPFKEIPASPFSVKKILTILQGVAISRKIIKEFQPDLVIGFGSYFTFPLLLSALLMGVPIMLHEQNALPGRVNRLFSPFAKTTAVSFPKTVDLLRGENIVEVTFPLRQTRILDKVSSEIGQIFDGSSPCARLREKRIDSWEYFGLEKGKTTILVFGGSQGAKALNHLFMEIVPALTLDTQILHFTGDRESAHLASSLYKRLGYRYSVKDFEERMECAFEVADCALTRAGAATIAELVEWEKPALLIPFPFAKDDHQVVNGQHFVEDVKGGALLLQKRATPLLLKTTLFQLMEEREEKKKNIQKYKESKKLKEFPDLIIEFLEHYEK